MRNLVIILCFALGFFSNAQMVSGKDISTLSPEERYKILSALKPEEKQEILWKFRQNLMVEKLEISKEKQEIFGKIYQEYQREQKAIRDIFNPKFDIGKLSEKEAEDKLEKSFEVGEKHIQCRRKYAKELRKILSPQQILRMFQIEGEMKEKMMKKHENTKPKDN